MLNRILKISVILLAILSLQHVWADEVNVYSLRQPELIEPVFNSFSEITGIKVNVSYPEGGLVKRLQLEGHRSPADVVLTTDISRLFEMVEAEVVQPVSSSVLELNIPANYRDPDGEWFALTLRGRIIYASKQRVSDNEISNYEELADPEWKGRICTRSGTHSYNLALTSAYISHYGTEEAKEWLQGIKANLARKPQGNDRAQVKAIWAGECDISLGNTYYMGRMLDNLEQQQWANSVRLVFPIFANGGTHMNVSGMAMTRYAPNKDNALRLMEFLSSEHAQRMYAEFNHEYPVNPDVKTSLVVASWGEFKHDNLMLVDIAKLRPIALQLVEDVDFDG